MSADVGISALVRLSTNTEPRRRFFCMPYAGGGVAPFRLWHRTLPSDVEVIAVQLPGREARLRELPLVSIAQMIESVLPEIVSKTDLPYAIFGHSMGALLAFELALCLERSAVRGPDRLFISGHRAPDETDARPPLHALPTPAFLSELQGRYGPIPAPVLAEQELLDLLIPVVRADLRAVETYQRSTDAGRVACPVHVFGGSTDAHPTPGQLHGWSRCTAQPVNVRIFPGDHFYLNTEREALTREIATQWVATSVEADQVEAGHL